MKKRKTHSISINRSEKTLGWLYFAFELIFLPTLLRAFNARLAVPMSAGTLNFVYYIINFLAMVCIFRSFLKESFLCALRNFFDVIQAVILGAVAYFAASKALEWGIACLFPSFHNVNDSSISAMVHTDRILMTIGVVLLVPLTEETLYRGLIFRSLLRTSKIGAYLVSMAAFAAIHVLGYLGSADVGTLVLCFIQYLPAGLCLAWTYTKADNLFAPILVHAIVNAVAIGIVR